MRRTFRLSFAAVLFLFLSGFCSSMWAKTVPREYDSHSLPPGRWELHRVDGVRVRRHDRGHRQL